MNIFSDHESVSLERLECHFASIERLGVALGEYMSTLIVDFVREVVIDDLSAAFVSVGTGAYLNLFVPVLLSVWCHCEHACASLLAGSQSHLSFHLGLDEVLDARLVCSDTLGTF